MATYTAPAALIMQVLQLQNQKNAGLQYKRAFKEEVANLFGIIICVVTILGDSGDHGKVLRVMFMVPVSSA